MSIHVCKCEHNGRTEYHLRYPGMTHGEAQALADSINGGELVGAGHPLRKDAERYRWLAARLLAADFDYNGEGVQALVFELPAGCTVSADCNATIDAAMRMAPAVGAA